MASAALDSCDMAAKLGGRTGDGIEQTRHRHTNRSTNPWNGSVSTMDSAAGPVEQPGDMAPYDPPQVRLFLRKKLLAPAAASLRIKDFRKVSFADRIIRAIRDNNGVGRARHARIVLSGMCSLAVRLDALDDNPVRELTRVPQKRKSERRADRKVVLTEASVAGLRGHMAASKAV
jgi:hypothetical protein